MSNEPERLEYKVYKSELNKLLPDDWHLDEKLEERTKLAIDLLLERGFFEEAAVLYGGPIAGTGSTFRVTLPPQMTSMGLINRAVGEMLIKSQQWILIVDTVDEEGGDNQYWSVQTTAEIRVKV